MRYSVSKQSAARLEFEVDLTLCVDSITRAISSLWPVTMNNSRKRAVSNLGSESLRGICTWRAGEHPEEAGMEALQ